MFPEIEAQVEYQVEEQWRAVSGSNLCSADYGKLFANILKKRKHDSAKKEGGEEMPDCISLYNNAPIQTLTHRNGIIGSK